MLTSSGGASPEIVNALITEAVRLGDEILWSSLANGKDSVEHAALIEEIRKVIGPDVDIYEGFRAFIEEVDETHRVLSGFSGKTLADRARCARGFATDAKRERDAACRESTMRVDNVRAALESNCASHHRLLVEVAIALYEPIVPF